MEQTEFYTQLLGLERPWDIDEVKLDVAGGKVEVFLAPRHLPVEDPAQSQSAEGELPKVPGVRQTEAPWAEPGGRFTLMMECFVIAAIMQWRWTCVNLTSPPPVAHVPGSIGKAVFDRFHIAKHMGDCLIWTWPAN